MNTTEHNVLGTDPSCEGLNGLHIPSALRANTPRWNENFNSKTNKYEVAYFFTSGFDKNRKDTVREKLDEFARDTCVALVEKSKKDKDYPYKLEIVQNRGCSSYCGRHYEEQMLSLAKGCERSYVPLHEVKQELALDLISI